ncbi:MAG: hypothetical protein LAO03_16875 [Acidobacteriia bacterium]|nr:hypothetical protein [Terriglobia bacterium]
MQIPLDSPGRKALLLAACLLLTAGYLGFSLAEFVASYYSSRSDLASLHRSIWLQPGNAEYRYRLGRYFSLVEQAPQAAVDSFRSAVALNPHDARYWFDLASEYQLLGNTDAQKDALEHAIAANPRTPDAAWEAANFYLVQGETDKALHEFRVVLENNLGMAPAALKLCWRINPDVDAILQSVVPPDPQVYFAFLDILMAKKETAGAAKVWAQLAQLRQPFAARHIFDYFRYLIAMREVDQARTVWQEAATLCGLSAYLPSSQNLMVNGDFSLDVLNGGFDWSYLTLSGVSLAFDPSQPHLGHRSLSMVFDSRGLDDAGIRQLVPVEPNTAYEFSAYFKAENIQGAGGPRFTVQDVYHENIYFQSDDLKDADFWKPVGGAFITGPDAKLLVVRVQRVPGGSPIKGKLWIGSVRLARKH